MAGEPTTGQGTAGTAVRLMAALYVRDAVRALDAGFSVDQWVRVVLDDPPLSAEDALVFAGALGEPMAVPSRARELLARRVASVAWQGALDAR